MSFRLFHLPYLAIENIIRMYTLDEIFSLSSCSRKAYRIIKSIKMSNQGIKLLFSVGSCPRIELEYEDDVHCRIYIKHASELPDGDSSQVARINNFKVPMTKGEHGDFELYWSDTKSGMKEVATNVSGIFNCKFNGFSIVFETDPSSQIWAIDWMNSFQASVKVGCFCTLEGVEPLASDLTYMFANLKITDFLYVRIQFSDNLQRPNIQIAPQTANLMEISPAFWMTLDHVLAFECATSFFTLSNLTNLDMNALLKHAENGWNPHLKHCSISLVEGLNYDVMLEGIEATIVPDDVVREYTNSDGVYKINGGYDIKRKTDGSTITLGRYGPQNRCFDLVVASVPLVIDL